MTDFSTFVEATLAEFTERMPAVAVSQLVRLPAPDMLEQLPAFRAACARFGGERAKAAFDEGFAILKRHGATREPGSAVSPLMQIVTASILDALAAREGELDIDTSDQAASKPERHCYGERRYFTWGQAPQAVIVLNALGISYHCWERLARAGIDGHRIILFESRSTDLETGGVRNTGNMDDDIADLLALIEHEGLDQVVLLGWCSGARAAIEFSWRHPDRIRQLILLAPTLHQTRGLAAHASPFEDDLDRVSKMVKGRASLAGHFVKALAESRTPPDEAALAQDLAADGKLFLSLPRYSNAALVVQPFVDGPSLLNHCLRISSDVAAMTIEKLASLPVEILVIQGESDTVVNNKEVRDALGHCSRHPAVGVVMGAGHYPHDLQYHYVRKLITDFTRSTLGAQPSARIAIHA